MDVSSAMTSGRKRVRRRAQGRDVTEEVEGYYAVVSFTIDEGTFTINSYDCGVNAPLYPTDSPVTVVYRPGNPEGARIQQEIGGFREIFGPLILTVFGIVCTGFGGVPTLLTIKKDSTIPPRKEHKIL